jgi:amidohydrolase
MPVIEAIANSAAELTEWRRDLHAHPELAFEERRTSQFVCDRLSAFGIDFERGWAGTGVIATIKRGQGQRTVALRADMDALPIQETNGFAHRSIHPGRMHACGHDGHTVMLLGAARQLVEASNFNGTVHLIFQPAEESGGGARVMLEAGLLDRYPVDAVFGLHNMPGLPAGVFGLCEGPFMASSDFFRVDLKGKGAHAAFPHTGRDPILAATTAINALQSIVSRSVDPLDAAVVTVAMLRAGEALNVIPQDCVFGGTVRCFKPEVREEIERRFRAIVEGTACSYEAEADIYYDRHYPATFNSPRETAFAARIAAALVGDDSVRTDIRPSMAADDIAYLLQKRPGAMILIGNGVEQGGRMVHNPDYDFNDEILPLGASFWVKLAEGFLAEKAH